jgi:2-dehydro-3-deoxyphosphogluconate aldolase/(4S)-4-hydroxy-2-oxoglutarate aldolase
MIERRRISAIVRTDDQEVAAEAMEAAIAGGFRVIEFTLTTPGAIELVARFAKNPDLLVGAGTVLTSEAARQAVAAGAQFLVSPITDPSVIATANSLDVACLPGAYTPTELQLAHQSGAVFVKLFPAPAGGIAFIESVLAPLPHLRIFPTAGFTPDNFTDWLRAGCAGVGFARSLFPTAELEARDFNAIRLRSISIHARFAQWAASSE